MKKEDICAHCGESKWFDQPKHLEETMIFLQKSAATLGRLGGLAKSEKKAKSSRENGKKNKKKPA